MIIARPVIAPTDKRFFHIHFPWLLEDETIVSAMVNLIPPESDEEGLFTLSGTIDTDEKTIILKTNPVDEIGPPEEGTEYVADITILTSEDQMNTDQVIFIIDEGAY